MQQYEINFNNSLKTLRTKILSINDSESRYQISDEMEKSINKTLELIDTNKNLQSNNPHIMKMFYDMALIEVNAMIKKIDKLLSEQNRTKRF